MNILVIGLGLIGGSICKALSDRTSHAIWGYDRDKNTLEQALDFGCISSAVSENEFSNADMVIVCLHPLASRSFMETNIPKFKSNCIVFDVCGIKGQMVSDITDLALQYNIHYVGTHPMAGKEHSGFEFSDKDLFNNANFIVTPIDKTNSNALEIVITLAEQIGFGQIIKTDPFEHDNIIAYTSQLAHIVSSAYVKSPTLEKERGFSGGSFQDMTRIATLNEDMWTNLFLLNRDSLIFEIDTLTNNLTLYRDAISENDSNKLRELLRDSRILNENNSQNTL